MKVLKVWTLQTLKCPTVPEGYKSSSCGTILLLLLLLLLPKTQNSPCLPPTHTHTHTHTQTRGRAHAHSSGRSRWRAGPFVNELRSGAQLRAERRSGDTNFSKWISLVESGISCSHMFSSTAYLLLYKPKKVSVLLKKRRKKSSSDSFTEVGDLKCFTAGKHACHAGNLLKGTLKTRKRLLL